MGTLGIDQATIHEVLTSDSTSKQPLILSTLFIKVLKAFASAYVQRQDTWQKNRSFVVEVIVIITLNCKSVGDVPLHSFTYKLQSTWPLSWFIQGAYKHIVDLIIY